jgi:hypothetical protein
VVSAEPPRGHQVTTNSDQAKGRIKEEMEGNMKKSSISELWRSTCAQIRKRY